MSLRQLSNQFFTPTGNNSYCSNCGCEIPAGKKFCDVNCRDEYDRWLRIRALAYENKN